MTGPAQPGQVLDQPTGSLVRPGAPSHRAAATAWTRGGAGPGEQTGFSVRAADPGTSPRVGNQDRLTPSSAQTSVCGTCVLGPLVLDGSVPRPPFVASLTHPTTDRPKQGAPQPPSAARRSPPVAASAPRNQGLPRARRTCHELPGHGRPSCPRCPRSHPTHERLQPPASSSLQQPGTVPVTEPPGRTSDASAHSYPL